jgi:hydrogenase small subunit
MNVVNLVSVLVHYLTFREWPPADMMSRPLSAYGNLVHNECERRPHFEFGEFALAWGDEGAQRGWCLYKLGCKGPETMANCPEVRYGGGVSWNVRAGEGCIGCTTPSSWNQMGPAYDRLPAPVPILPDLTADKIGAVLIAGMGAVIVAHGTGMTIRFKRRSRIAAREAAAGASGAGGTASVAVAVADDHPSAAAAPPEDPAQAGEGEA